eukprot:TRINITY_DN21977_c0_g1_i1.p1 TRINITY_DN21977_c0_g1~~TRINITY_DN21977_c0_g1_i1.p1  ORF type:complete len:504 (-),score=77.91 TRINITY_DN21977_c0_g1_i1:20-1531(-)
MRQKAPAAALRVGCRMTVFRWCMIIVLQVGIVGLTWQISVQASATPLGGPMAEAEYAAVVPVGAPMATADSTDKMHSGEEKERESERGTERVREREREIEREREAERDREIEIEIEREKERAASAARATRSSAADSTAQPLSVKGERDREIEMEREKERASSAARATRSSAARSMAQPLSVKELEEKLVLTTKRWKFFQHHSHHYAPLKGLRVLDVGMGQGPLGVVALSLGVKHYTGLDPALRINETPRVRNIGEFHPDRMYLPFPFTGFDMMTAYPGKLVLLPGTFETARDNPALIAGGFDVATLYSVTEHLPNVTDVLEGIFNALHPGKVLVISHHNYYSFSGHHMLPKTPADFQPGNENHKKVAFWKHLEPSSPPYSDANLNRIRLGDLMAAIDVHFECSWRARLGNGNTKALAKSVLQPLQARGFSRAELLVDRVAFACARRAQAVPAPWLGTLPVHHAATDGSYSPHPLPAKMAAAKSEVMDHVPAGLKKLARFLTVL